MDAIENWSDVKAVMRGLIPPLEIDYACDKYERYYGLTDDAKRWLERVQAARVSLGDASEAHTTAQDGLQSTIDEKG